MEKTNFVQMVINKDALGFQNQFSEVMNEKVSKSLDDMKVEVARNFFDTQDSAGE